MIIINDNRTEAVRAADIVHISQGDNKTIVAWSILAVSRKEPDIFLGRYDSTEAAGIAFRMLIEALREQDDDIFFMPERNDPALKVNTAKTASVLSYRQGKTNGKNH